MNMYIYVYKLYIQAYFFSISLAAESRKDGRNFAVGTLHSF